MAKGAAGGGGGGAVKTALVVTGGLVLAWLTVESAFKPFLDRLRGAVSRSIDPARDPDEDTAAPAPEEDKSPATAAVAAAVASAVAEEKDPDVAVAEEKNPDVAVAAAEPSAPPLPAEAVEGEDKGEDKEVELGEKWEAAVAAKAE
ncbi:hypothetical protein CFC21_057746 [Triticum aestivum]|uniref:Uncharacterized protein n=2 Tax=Triticum aestivum TaxID=4565 RepID=A0A3B6PMV3_WHEAT|nr:uncharacterized protein LOC119325238 [Triticum dicoccoides]XP_044413827.1 uncharacterized protein LOC123138003 [Triticum aestivum]KAF7049158.1 hypothetical protein CFC21_057746 [Triticum aestivum]